MAKAERSAPVEQISRSILILRSQRVILDRELAAIYGATTKRLNEQVKRNRDRFPEDFMFQLTAEEVERSRSQFATLNSGRGQNIKYRPFAFTEHGAVQVANVLNSPRAIEPQVCSGMLSALATKARSPQERPRLIAVCCNMALHKERSEGSGESARRQSRTIESTNGICAGEEHPKNHGCHVG